MKKTKRTTYLLGAGASCDAVPLAGELPGVMRQWARGIRTDSRMLENCGNHPHYGGFFGEVDRCAGAAKDSGGIDAYARVLYLREERDELHRLKAVLSCWLLAAQRGGKRDLRYFPFLASFAAKGGGPAQVVFRPGSNILTWNYDLQPEIACYRHLKIDPDYITQTLTAPPHETGTTNEIDEEHFFLVRLNGCAGSHIVGSNGSDRSYYARAHRLIYPSDGFEAMSKILDLYGSYVVTRELAPAISFAWETDSMYHRFFRDPVRRALEHTTHLVVIGYSFPDTNRSIDEELLCAMNPQEIVIQDPRPDLVEARMLRLLKECPIKGEVRITRVDRVSQFETW